MHHPVMLCYAHVWRRVWDLATSEAKLVLQASFKVYGVAISGNGCFVVSGDEEGFLK